MSKKSGNYSLLALAVPILIEQVLRNFLGTVNVFMLGNYSDDAVAAVGVANQIISVVLVAFTMIASGAAVVINQSLGALKDEEAGLLSMNAIGIGAILGAVVSAFLLALSPQILMLLGLEAKLVSSASVYLRWVGGASIFIAVSSVISILFRCYGNAKIPMVVVMLINLINVLGNYFVIFRPFPFFLEGVEGVGVVRFFSEAVGVLLLAFLLARARFPFHRPSRIFKIRPSAFKSIVSLGFMSGAEGISYMMSQVVTTGFLTAYGTVALSAKVYVNTVDYYAYVIGMSIGQAAQVIAGQLMGAGKFDEAYRYINRRWIIVFACNMAFSTSIFFLHRPLMSLFTSNEEIISLSAPLFLLCIAINLGRSFNHTFNFGLRAAGYAFWPMIIASSSIWLVNCGLGYVFCTLCGMGAVGLWIGMAADDVLRGGILTLVWHTRRWENAVRAIQARTRAPEQTEGSGGADSV